MPPVFHESVASLLAGWGDAPDVAYARDGLRGECLAPLREFSLLDLPFDDAPRASALAANEDAPRRVKYAPTRSVLTLRLPATGGDDARPPRRVFVKRYTRPNLWRLLLTFGRGSRARAEWRLGWRLLARGVPTAVPLLWAERRRGGFWTDTWLVTLGLEARSTFREVWRGPVMDDERSAWLARLGRFIRRAHDAGFAHDDLSADHVLVEAGDPPGGEPRLYFIDLDNSRFMRALTPYRRAHNFFQIFRSLRRPDVTRAQRQAFYDAYFGPGAAAMGEEYERRVARVRAAKALKKWWKG